MRRGVWRWLAIAALTMAGCTGLEPSMVGVGVTAVETGATVLGRGKVGTYEVATFQEAGAAVRLAGKRLAMRLERQHETRLGEAVFFRDDRGTQMLVAIEWHTTAIMFIRADVGLVGPTGLAAIFIKQVQKELEDVKKGEGRK